MTPSTWALIQKNGNSFSIPSLGRFKDRLQDMESCIKRSYNLDGSWQVPEIIGLILCSYDVQLFKSSKQAFWPVLLTVTNLPPGMLMNIILAGLWHGPVKTTHECHFYSCPGQNSGLKYFWHSSSYTKRSADSLSLQLWSLV